MTITLTDPKKIKSTRWALPSNIEHFNNMSGIGADNAQYCCGVLELGNLPEGDFFNALLVVSQQKDERWGEPVYSRNATEEEIFKLFQEFLKEYNPGMFVSYLLDSQHKGDMGKLFKMDEWTYHGSFWNPNSRNTLHHYSKVNHKGPPKSKSKSILGRK